MTFPQHWTRQTAAMSASARRPIIWDDKHKILSHHHEGYLNSMTASPVVRSRMECRVFQTNIHPAAKGRYILEVKRTVYSQEIMILCTLMTGIRNCHQSFSITGPKSWNNLPKNLKNLESDTSFTNRPNEHLLTDQFNTVTLPTFIK